MIRRLKLLERKSNKQVGESAKRFPTRAAIQNKKKERDELRGWAGKNPQTRQDPNLTLEKTVRARHGATVREAMVCIEKGVTGGRQKTRRGRRSEPHLTIANANTTKAPNYVVSHLTSPFSPTLVSSTYRLTSSKVFAF